MAASVGAVLAAVGTGLWILAACGGAGGERGAAASDLIRDSPPARTAAADSFRGTIAVVGADPLTQVVLQTDSGQQLRLTGEATPSLRDLDGIDVLLDGRMDGERLRVGTFRVVGAHGQPAVDGILEVEGDMAIVVTPDGTRTRYSPAPVELRDRVGERVWIAGTPGGQPEAWGVIEPTG